MVGMGEMLKRIDASLPGGLAGVVAAGFVVVIFLVVLLVGWSWLFGSRRF